MTYPNSADHSRETVKNRPGLILIFDENHVLTYLAPELEALLGYRPGELPGRPVFDLVHGDDMQEIRRPVAAHASAPEARPGRVRLISKTGEYRPLEVTGNCMLPDQGILFLAAEPAGNHEPEDHAYFRSLFRHAPCAICAIGLDGVIREVSCRMEKILGLHHDLIRGRRIEDIIFGDSQIRPAVRYLAEGRASVFASRVCTGSGEIAEFLVRMDPVFVSGQVVGGHIILEDTARMVSDADQTEMLSLVASKTTNSVIITDAEHRAEWVNAAFTRVTGYPLSRIRGTVPFSLLEGPETSPAARVRIENNRKAKVSFTEEILYYTITGDPIWFRMEVTPLLDQRGHLVRTITILTDITEKKRTEQELYKLTQDLSRQNQDLQQFTYMVSHNLRSPIANCKGLLELLSGMDKTDPFFDDSLQMLHSSVANLERITADMNSILTFRDQNSQSAPESINLRSFLKDAVKDFQDFRSCSLTQINNKVPPDLFLRGNRGFLHNIFTNLISNSIKYRADDRKLQIDLQAWHADSHVFITLQDNGLGFDSDKLKNQLFKLYKRFHTGREEGRGIGLYLVKTAVEAMNGKINVESTPGIGTKFMISIPASH